MPQNELLTLIDLAGYAPSGHNSQSVKWLVLGDRDELQHLAGITVDWMRWMLDNMSGIAVSLNMDRAIRRWDDGKDIILRNAPVVIIAHGARDDFSAPTSSTIALAHLELAATSMGLGCCWAGYFHAAATTFPPYDGSFASSRRSSMHGFYDGGISQIQILQITFAQAA